MLKSFYKTFLISILCGSLTLLNAPLYAQEVRPEAGTSSEPNQKATALMSKSVNPNLTRDANGVIKSHESKSFSGAKVDDDGPLHIITMLAVGVVGTKLLMYKKWTTDMTIVAAASAAYIAAEIINIMNLKNEIKGMNMEVTRSSDGKVDQAQIETLEKLKESYEKVQKSAKTKMMLQKAAGTAFLAALAVAAYQRYSEDGKFASCEAGISHATEQLTAGLATAKAENEAAIKAYQAAVAASPSSAALVASTAKEVVRTNALVIEYDACLTQVGTVQTSVTSYKTQCDAAVATSTSLFSFTATRPTWKAAAANTALTCTGTGVAAGIKNAMVTPPCETYLGEKEFNLGYGIPPKTANNPRVFDLEKLLFFKSPPPKITKINETDAPVSFKKYLQKSLDLFFPKAEAGVMASLGLVGAAATTFTLTHYGMTQTIDSWMFTPGARMIAWGVMSGAAFFGANQTDKEIKKIGGQIAEIDKILKDLGTLKKGIKSSNVSDQQINLAAVNAMQAEDTPLSVNSKEKMDCLVSSGANKCTALTDTLKAMPGFADLPDSLKNIASQSAQLGDGLSGSSSISGSTLGIANSLAGKQNAISKLNDSLKSKINAGLAKSKQTIDFDKKANELAASLKATTQRALASKGTNGGAFLSSMGINPSTVSAPPSNTASLNTMKKSSFPGAGGAGASAPAKDKDKDFALDFKEAGIDGTGAAPGADGAGWGKDNFDIGTNDINTNSGESIFQVISNRYIKSGYPRLLDEIPAAKN